MDMASMKRCDSLSPEMKPCPPASNSPTSRCPASQIPQQGHVGTKANHKYTFIMANVSDFDGKSGAFVQGKVSRKVAVKKSQTASRDPKRLPSLSATHPALYQCAMKETFKKETLPLSPADHRIKKEKLRRVKVETLDGNPPAPWQTYVDPKSLTSQEPAFDDPRVRMLRTDVLYSHDRVISPVLMVGLPCGTIVEAAHVYYDHQGQPRDPPGS